MRRLPAAGFAALLGCSTAAMAAAPTPYPAKPVRIVVPYAPGGSNDVVSRTIAPRLSDIWGQPAIVDNRPGAGSMLGTELVARATPDGYTLLATSGALAISVSLYRLPFDPLRDLASIAFMAQMPYVLAVHPSLPVSSTRDFIRLAAANPGKYSFSSAGTATATHLTGEIFKAHTRIDLLHVPYKGGGPAVNAIVSNEVQVIFNVVTGILPQARAGRVRPLAVTSAKRAAIVPELPTLAESGVPGFDVVSGYTLFAPGKTPRDIVARVNASVNAVLKQPDVQKHFLALGVTPIASTPESLDIYMKAEVNRWAKVIRDANIKVD